MNYRMKLAGKTALGLIGIVMAVAAVIAVRTATYAPAGTIDLASVSLAPAAPIDLDRAAAHLAEAVRIRTISHQDPAENDWAEWDRLHVWLATTYPAAHAAMTREVVGGHTLVYTWPGIDPARRPIVLLAHHDVVPVTAGTEGDWQHPPFAGVIADGAVWGRGAIDNKGSLVGLFEALDALAASGFEPGRTVIVVSGHDEEAGGSGAAAAAKLLESRNIAPEFVLDEGLAVVADFPLLGRPTALIGVAEKGYGTLRITAPAKGGHSSSPPPETGVEVLAQALLAITSQPFPLKFDGPAANMVRALAPQASPLVKMAVANEWLFGPLLVRQIAATPAGAATLHTTIAPTMLRGSPKENVLPQDAAGWINYRIAPDHSADAVMQHALNATRGLDVKVEWVHPPYDPPPVSSDQSDGFRIIAAAASDGGRLPVAPGLVNATTDSRYFAAIAQDVYRFQPLVASLREFEMIHGTNERLTLDNLRRMTEFYSQLIATAAR
jgi:carboxypeptidase PM20D1